jgi:hypothetical protein
MLQGGRYGGRKFSVQARYYSRVQKQVDLPVSDTREKAYNFRFAQLVRSQTLYPAELRAHGTLFTINSLPQFLLRIQPRESQLPVIWVGCFGQVIPLIRNGLTKMIFTFDCLALLPNAHSANLYGD